MNDDLENYVCAGYFVARPSAAPRGASDLVPSAIVTVSTCIATTLPNWWAFPRAQPEAGRQEQAAKECGVETRLKEFLRWTSHREVHGELRYPSIFVSLAIAREMLHRFGLGAKDWRLLGLGIKRDFAGSFLKEFAPNQSGWNNGLYDVITLNAGLDGSGQLLGYDVLGIDGDTIHSWLCNDLDTRAHQIGIHCGALGLLETHGDAENIASDAMDPEIGAEPVPWYPWALYRYAI